MARFITPAETARLVRNALKRNFPHTRFGVTTKTYSGGASVTVRWVDGPAVTLVERVAKPFAGGRFDGSIDYAWSVDHYLMPDGSATVAREPGTLDSMGSHAPQRQWKPSPDAERVQFGANFIFCTREYSPAFMARVMAKVVRDGITWEGDAGEIDEHGWPRNANACLLSPQCRDGAGRRQLLSDVLHQVRHRYMIAA